MHSDNYKSVLDAIRLDAVLTTSTNVLRSTARHFTENGRDEDKETS